LPVKEAQEKASNRKSRLKQKAALEQGQSKIEN